MSAETVKLGVVGCGWAGRQAVLAAAAGPRTEIVAISDLDKVLRRSVAEEFAVPHACTDYGDLLRIPDVHAVYLAVNPVMRRPMVFDALDAGKHVLVQKPHAVRADEIPEFAAAANEAGKTLQFCYFMRHFPQNRMRRKALLSGKIGEVYHGRIFLKFNCRPDPEGITKWLQVYGQKGGALGQHASHELDLVWWWMGCPKPEWAYAVKHSVYPAYDGPEGPAEDYFSGLVGLEGGRTIQIDCSRWLHCDTSTVVEIYGSEGALSGGKLCRFRDGEFAQEEIDEPLDIAHSDPPEGVCFHHELEHFAMAIAGEVEPDVNAANAYQFMRILDALYDSAKAGEKVNLC